jgi:redox-sensitive bicupin YhaK (pirin superfamily)
LNILLKKGHTTLACVIEGEILGLKENKEIIVKERNTILFDKEGEKVFLRTGKKQARIILLTGRPFEEPIAWYGPIVMSTKDELIQAFKELREGKFIKHKATEIDDITS